MHWQRNLSKEIFILTFSLGKKILTKRNIYIETGIQKDMVEKRIIKFQRAKVTKYDRHTDIVYFDLFVTLNGSQQVLKKQFSLAESFEALKDKMMNDVKQQFSSQNQRYDDDDFLGNALIVMIDDFDELEESLVTFFKRVKEKVRQFRGNKSAEGYLNLYNSFDNIEYKF